MNKINRINQYILERYPNLWNTRFFWFVLIGLGIHIIFFIAGVLLFVNNDALKYDVSFYNYQPHNIAISLSVIISIITLTMWAMRYFKNNAFKNFYPLSKNKLLLQILLTFFIIIINSSFYISYHLGYKIYILNKYPTKTIATQKNDYTIIKAMLPIDYEEYTPARRNYPTPFDSLYCETDKDLINENKPYILCNQNKYQFYTKRIFTKPKNLIKGSKEFDYFSTNCIDQSEDSLNYYFTMKDVVVDVSSHFTKSTLNLYNYSFPYQDIIIDNKEIQDYSVISLFHNILSKGDKKEFEYYYDRLIAFSNEFNIKHNLSKDYFINLVYHPETDYRVDSFLWNAHMIPLEYYDSQSTSEKVMIAKSKANQLNNGMNGVAPVPVDIDAARAVNVDDYAVPADMITEEINHKDTFYEKRLSGVYYHFSAAENVFSNIHELKKFNHLRDSFFLLLWISYFISILIFVFRNFGWKPLIFAILTSGVVGVLFSLFLFVGLKNVYYNTTTYIYGLTIALFIFFIIMSYSIANHFSKVVRAVPMVISFIGFAPFVFLILQFIDSIQEAMLKKQYGDKYYDLQIAEQSFLNVLGYYTNWVVLAGAILLIIIFIRRIYAWKSSTEG